VASARIDWRASTVFRPRRCGPDFARLVSRSDRRVRRRAVRAQKTSRDCTRRASACARWRDASASRTWRSWIDWSARRRV